MSAEAARRIAAWHKQQEEYEQWLIGQHPGNAEAIRLAKIVRSQKDLIAQQKYDRACRDARAIDDEATRLSRINAADITHWEACQRALREFGEVLTNLPQDDRSRGRPLPPLYPP